MKGFLVTAAAAGIGMGIVLASSAYVVDEGRVGVVTYMGKAERQEKPSGLQFKAPFVSGVREFDVRERSVILQLAGATSNQLNTTADISFNWRPDPERIMEIFVQYGSPEEFGANILQPRLSQSAKATIGKFSSVQLTQERNAVAEAILTDAQRILAQYPAILSSAQVENFTLPQRYWEAVLQREEQREITDREQLLLEQQRLTAQREVQTAEAQRDAAKATADGAAYSVEVRAEAQAKAILIEGEAKAAAIKAQQDALANNPLFVEYARVQAWDGTLPEIVMGDQPELLMQMK